MNDLVATLRERAAACLPPRAFLKRDRGDALFITNALRIDPDCGCTVGLSEKGFITDEDSGLVRILPGKDTLLELERQYPEAPDHLSKTLTRFSGMAPEHENLVLFAQGLRILDGDPAGDYEIRLRKRAAVCLRNHTGGGLYACALINHIIQKEYAK
jgi:hypothetical protein